MTLDSRFCSDTDELTSVDENGKITLLVPYQYESKLELIGGSADRNRTMRITQELTTLSNSLPLSYSSSVFVRCDEERLDVMKVLPISCKYYNWLLNLALSTRVNGCGFNPMLGADNRAIRDPLREWVLCVQCSVSCRVSPKSHVGQPWDHWTQHCKIQPKFVSKWTGKN